MKWMYIESQMMCLLMLIILFVYHIRYEYRERKELKLVYLFSILTMVSDIVQVLLSSYAFVHYLCNVLYIGFLGMTGAMWTQYCFTKYESRWSKTRVFRCLKYAPVAISVLYVVFFGENEFLLPMMQNEARIHNTACLLSFILCLYAAAIWVVAIRTVKQTKSDRKRSEMFFPAILSTVPVLAGVIQALLPVGVSLIPFSLCVLLIIFKIHTLYRNMRIDNLTKLPNRYGMEDEIREQLEEYRRNKNDLFYIIACDMDRFKQINDSWGHPEGDRALELISAALDRVVQEYDSKVFRVGGDEFIIIVDTSEDALPKEICEKIKRELDVLEFRDDFDICMSMGIAKYDGSTDVAELLNNADKELYEVKRNGKENT